MDRSPWDLERQEAYETEARVVLKTRYLGRKIHTPDEVLAYDRGFDDAISLLTSGARPPYVRMEDGEQVEALLSLPFDKCDICHAPMVPPVPTYYKHPLHDILMRLNNYRREAHWTTWSDAMSAGNKPICTDCKKTGVEQFICYICDRPQPTAEIHESFGSVDPHHLCKTCFETVPAKKWDEATTHLYGEHRYDDQ